MFYSQLIGKTLRAVSQDISSLGHEYLLRGGFIKESTAGRYYLLPLGLAVHEKICAIVSDELSKIGAQKMSAPILHPKELWNETNRAEAVSFELMEVKDRSDRSFILGGTAEEMMVALVRQLHCSEKDLPFCIYQISQKFRDELRARGGLLRVREFTMKDAYSFHASKEDFESYYEQMKRCYDAIFCRLDLNTIVVASDNGYMGGDYCHEFIVEHALGESFYVESMDGSYRAHTDIATFHREAMNKEEALAPLKVVHAPRGSSIEDGVQLHQQPSWRQIKSLIYHVDNREFVLVSLRGDLLVSETKLKNILSCSQLRLAHADEVERLGSVIGFVSPLRLSIRKIGDYSLTTVNNFITGADEYQKDTINVTYGRDFVVDQLTDIAEAQEGFLSETTRSPLQLKRGIEVGNIFQLGTWYTDKMVGATFTGKDGGNHPYYMGCYGIGIGRTMATIAETHHDQRGLIWPEAVAPYDIHLIAIGKNEDVKKEALTLYEQLNSTRKKVLYDDRDCSAGIKFTDADLLGIPERIVVSQKTIEARSPERSKRAMSAKSV